MLLGAAVAAGGCASYKSYKTKRFAFKCERCRKVIVSKTYKIMEDGVVMEMPDNYRYDPLAPRKGWEQAVIYGNIRNEPLDSIIRRDLFPEVPVWFEGRPFCSQACRLQYLRKKREKGP